MDPILSRMHRYWIVILCLLVYCAGSAHGQDSGEAYAVLKARILDEQGRVLANTTLQLELLGASRTGKAIKASRSTDQDGYIQWKLQRKYRAGSKRTLRIIQASANQRPPRAAILDLSRAYKGGTQNLGDWVLRELSILASGVIRGPHGEGMPGVEITVLAAAEPEHSKDPMHWESRRHLNTYTDTYGRFEVRDFADASQYRFSFRTDGFVPVQRDLSPGSLGLEIAMKKFSVFHGRVLVDDGIDPRDLEVIMVPVGEPIPRWRIPHRLQLGREGILQMPGLSEQDYLLVVRALKTQAELFRIERVAVGGFAAKPEVRQINLRGKLRVLQVTVVAESGAAPESISLQSLDAGRILRIPGQRAELLAPLRGLDLAISAEGKRYEFRRNVREDLQVIMREAYPVQVALMGLENTPKDWDFEATFHCIWLDEESGCEFGEVHCLDYDSDGIARFRVRHPGTYLLMADLSYSSPGSMCGIGWSVGKDGDWSIVVEDQEVEQIFRIDMAEPLLEAWQSRLEYLHKKQSQ